MSSKPYPLTVSSSMLRDRLALVTVAWFNKNNVPPRDLSGYEALAQDLKEMLDELGDTPWFVLGLEHILLDPDPAAARGYVNTRYAYTDEAARSLLLYLLDKLAPGKTLDSSGPAAGVCLAEIEPEEWAQLRSSQTLPTAA